MAPPLRIAFVHPDLGIGGAERLVIDAAAALQQAGHRVTIFAGYRDPKRCFEAARDGSLEVKIRGALIPLQVGQHLRAPLAIARMCYASLRIGLGREKFDVIFADLVAQAVPLLRGLSKARIIFYCHFPDRLLAPHRGGLYRWYRVPIDWAEAAGVGRAHLLLTNSRFTAAVARAVFPRLDPSRVQVLYPGVEERAVGDPGGANKVIVLSINRHERSKNLALAIEAFATLRQMVPARIFSTFELIIAGGFDERLSENRAVLRELSDLARRRSVAEQVTFLQNPSDPELRALLAQARCLLYTSPNEHFGYVVVEAMAAGRPVIAADSGGPRETMLDGVTGFLRAPTAEAFGTALACLASDPALAARMGQAAREHVARHFSKAAFGARLCSLVEALADGGAGVER